MSRERGFAFESSFVQRAKERGLNARLISGHKPHDAVVAGLRVQCKSKEFDEEGRVRIAKGQHRYKQGDWDVLALDFKGTLYLIPESRLRTSGTTLKTVIRPRFFKKWIDAWHVFDAAKGSCVPDQCTFDFLEATDGRHHY